MTAAVRYFLSLISRYFLHPDNEYSYLMATSKLESNWAGSCQIKSGKVESTHEGIRFVGNDQTGNIRKESSNLSSSQIQGKMDSNQMKESRMLLDRKILCSK